jgi:predicted acetyltransferase
MQEIRAVHHEELDAMLAVMCESFMLPFASARDLFYKDPYFDIEKKRALLEDGEIISCLTIMETRMWIGAAAAQVGGVAGVATRPTHRRNGYAGRLLEETIRTLRAQRCPFSALFPFSYDYYRRFGWEHAGTQMRVSTAPNLLPTFTDSRQVRPALPSDIAEMQQIYDQSSHRRTGSCLRDRKRWTYLFEYAKKKVVYRRKKVEGYLLFDLQQGVEGRHTLKLLEMKTLSEAAQRGLIGYLAGCAEAEEIEYISDMTGLQESGLLQPGREPLGGLYTEAMPGVMFRIVHPEAALQSLSTNFAGFRGVVTLVIHDSLLQSAPTMTTIEGDGVTTEIRAGGEKVNPRYRIEGDVRAWSQVFFGYHSLEDALALQRLRAYSESSAALAAGLFPRRAPFISAPDHF